MSALPTAFPVPTLPRMKPVLTTRNMRVALQAKHNSGRHHALQVSSTSAHHMPDFTSAFDTYRRRIYSQCFSMLHNHSDAEDASQEVFLQLFRKAHTFRGESSFSTWLYRLTTNCVLMEIRKMRHRFPELALRGGSSGTEAGKAALDPPLDGFPSRTTSIFDRVSLGVAMSQLPKGYRRIFHLHDVEGYTHEEIATLLRIRVGTSKSQLHKARLRMRLLLQSGNAAAAN